MIKINKRFSIEKDKHCWVLYETMISKKKKSGESQKATYHPNISQISEAILNRSGDKCESIEELKDLYENAVEKLTGVIQDKIKPVRRRQRKHLTLS